MDVMPRPPLPEDIVDMLRKPNPAVIATIRPDGQPISVATWYVWADGRILVNMDEGRKRLDYLRRDPRVSITVLDLAGWTTHVSMQGIVTELVDDENLTDIDRIATHYTGKPYSNRDRGRVSAWIEPDRWHSWGRFRQD
jgi:PPOX class probable F420-dependent enzyme